MIFKPLSSFFGELDRIIGKSFLSWSAESFAWLNEREGRGKEENWEEEVGRRRRLISRGFKGLRLCRRVNDPVRLRGDAKWRTLDASDR